MDTGHTTNTERLASELGYIDVYRQEKLEEFAFHVAEDLHWLNDYAEKAIGRVALCVADTLVVPLDERSPLHEIQNVNAYPHNSKQKLLPHTPHNVALAQEPAALPSGLLEIFAIPAVITEEANEIVSHIAHSEPMPIEHLSVNVSSPAHERPPVQEHLLHNEEQDPSRPFPEITSTSTENTGMMFLQQKDMPARRSSTVPIVSPEMHCNSSEPVFPPHEAAAENLDPQNTVITTTEVPGGTESEPIGSQMSAPQDYMEPINLTSPAKRDPSRADSAYFSATESPTMSKISNSPRQSVAFASLPARQPFAKKSIGPRSSHNRGSVLGAAKPGSKTPNPSDCITIDIKLEPKTTPRVSNVRAAAVTEKVVSQEDSTTVSGQDDFRDPLFPDSRQHAESSSTISIINQGIQTASNLDLQPTSSEDIGDKIPTSPREEDEWLPRFDIAITSPRRAGQEAGQTQPINLHPLAIKHVTTDLNKRQSPLNCVSPARIDINPSGTSEKHAAGPIRAAMQAASAKATSYLRQARTAFGSPNVSHTRVFPSTTPAHSPPKLQLKQEPQTPTLYPDLNPTHVPTKPSMIPSKTPRKDPIREQKEQDTPRRSPRRSPKKGNEASQSMAVMAARSATRHASHHHDRIGDRVEERESTNSPRKGLKLLAKFPLQPKAKPIIRVATASQREFDNTKDRKTHAPQNPVQSSGSAAPLLRSASEDAQLDCLGKSQSGAAKRAAPSRQIKALAAANQAKEKADREQERRDHQRREIDRKRQEAKRHADVEEKRKVEQDESKKRKAPVELRATSAKKQQVRTMPSKGTLREQASIDKVPEVPTTKAAQQPPKRPLAEIGETFQVTISTGLPDPKRRCTDDQCEVLPLHKEPVSKPVRVSLQKKSLFGHPGEPGYKKPTVQQFTKSGPSAEVVKFSNDHIRFAASATTQAGNESIKAINLPPSELIELPEINSDYSDSDDDEPPQKDGFERPSWAESPELRKLLRRQQKIDPDDVFGPVQPLQMEEIFKGKERALARFRPRSSSANWSGNDKLTTEEVVEYARVMGYRN